MKPYLYVEARGSEREIGRQRGEAAREQVAASVAAYEAGFELMAGISFTEAAERAQPYLQASRLYLPGSVNELEGISEGAGVPFMKLFVLHCSEEFICEEVDTGGRCTSMALMWQGQHVVAHNEDWYACDAENYIVVNATLEGELQVLTMTAAAFLLGTGITSHGVAVCGNTLYSSDNRVGVPAALVGHSVLWAATPEGSMEKAALASRSRGANYVLGDTNGRIWDVETSGAASATTEADDWFVHTNHYLEPSMQAVEASTYAGSRLRLTTARQLVSEGKAKGDSPREVATRVLRDHANAPLSICSHPDGTVPAAQQEMTCASMIWDLDAMTMEACAGPPCENRYQRFSLR